MKFTFRAKSLVQNFQPETNRNLSAEDHAATVIQKAFRGYLQRKLFLLELNELFLDRIMGFSKWCYTENCINIYFKCLGSLLRTNFSKQIVPNWFKNGYHTLVNSWLNMAISKPGGSGPKLWDYQWTLATISAEK